MDQPVPPATPDAAAARALPAAGPPSVAPRAPPRRLAVRLAWLMVVVLLVAEASFVIPSLVRQRGQWLERRMTEAQLAAFSVAVAPEGSVDPATREELLRLAGAEAILLEQAGHRLTVLSHGTGLPDATSLDLSRETTLGAVLHTVASVLDGSDGLLAITGASPLREGASVTLVLHRAALRAMLIEHVRRAGTISLVIASAAGVLLYVALLVLLVHPMRRLTASIAAFRADPERSAPFDAAGLARHREDEITAAGRELAAMQRELRAALWRNARLAALGTAVAKVNHDLRGILSPAMLTAERLQTHADPAVKRAGDVLVRAVERAADLTSRTLQFTRETPVALPRQRMALRPAVDEAAELARAACPTLTVGNHVPPDIAIEADRESVVRVLGNLLRNAGEAEALKVSVTAAREGDELAIIVADDGPGLPDEVRAALFRPFVHGGRRGSTGLGLAIVHDLIRAHGGEVMLVDTGPNGTRFRLALPARICVPPRPPAT